MMEVAAITVDRAFAKGELIYSAGKEDKRLFVIHEGRVKISRISPNGKAQVIRILGPGEFMGELTILNTSPATDYAQALENCRMCVIEGTRLVELMRKYPSIALKAMAELSARLEKAENLIENINLHSAEQRLASALLEQSGGERTFELALSKGDFASQLGMTQETLSRKLALFQEDGLIDLSGQRTIVIRDRGRLEEIGQGEY
jgi:CRP/FNR family transcriptional regulator